ADRLQQLLNRTKDDYLNLVGHELRTPLSIIALYLYELHAADPATPPAAAPGCAGPTPTPGPGSPKRSVRAPPGPTPRTSPSPAKPRTPCRSTPTPPGCGNWSRSCWTTRSPTPLTAAPSPSR